MDLADARLLQQPRALRPGIVRSDLFRPHDPSLEQTNDLPETIPAIA